MEKMTIQYYVKGILKFTAIGKMKGKNFYGRMQEMGDNGLLGLGEDCFLKNPTFVSDIDDNGFSLIRIK